MGGHCSNFCYFRVNLADTIKKICDYGDVYILQWHPSGYSTFVTKSTTYFNPSNLLVTICTTWSVIKSCVFYIYGSCMTLSFFCSPATRHGGAWGERRYSSYSFSTSALDGVSGQRHAPAALLPPGKGPPVPIVQEAGWAPEQVWTQRQQEKSFVPAGDRTPIARSSSP
jgi:hypothetical protein